MQKPFELEIRNYTKAGYNYPRGNLYLSLFKREWKSYVNISYDHSLDDEEFKEMKLSASKVFGEGSDLSFYARLCAYFSKTEKNIICKERNVMRIQSMVLDYMKKIQYNPKKIFIIAQEETDGTVEAKVLEFALDRQAESYIQTFKRLPLTVLRLPIQRFLEGFDVPETQMYWKNEDDVDLEQLLNFVPEENIDRCDSLPNYIQLRRGNSRRVLRIHVYERWAPCHISRDEWKTLHFYYMGKEK